MNLTNKLIAVKKAYRIKVLFEKRGLTGTILGFEKMDLPANADIDKLVTAWNDSTVYLEKGYTIEFIELISTSYITEFVREFPVIETKPLEQPNRVVTVDTADISMLEIVSSLDEQIAESKKAQTQLRDRHLDSNQDWAVSK